MAYATTTEYAARLKLTLTPADEAQVSAYLDDASELVDAHSPPGWTPPAGLARGITIAATHRVITNPGGLRSRTVLQTAETYGEDGGLYLSEEEIAALQAAYERTARVDVDAATIMPADAGLTSRGWYR